MVLRSLRISVAASALLFAGNHSAMAQSTQAVPCTKTQFYDSNVNGATQLVAAGRPITVCGFVLFAAATANVGLVQGTGTNCGTNLTKITPAYQLTAQTGIADNSPFFRGLSVPSSTALCINSSATASVQGQVYFDNR